MRPELGTQYLSTDDAAKKSANFLFDEVDARLSEGPIRFGVFVQVADPAVDDVTDASSAWPQPAGDPVRNDRADEARRSRTPERRKIIFDPHPRDGRHRRIG
jgi:catalase